MKKIYLAIFLVISGNLNLFAQSEITQEEYDFYSKFLNKRAVITRNTISFELDPQIEKLLNKLPKDLVEDLLRKNEQPAIIEDKLIGFKFPDKNDPNWNVYNSEKNEIHFVFQERQFVSRVGFSGNKKYALVYVANGTEGLPYGNSILVWFVRSNGMWKKKKDFLISEY